MNYCPPQICLFTAVHFFIFYFFFCKVILALLQSILTIQKRRYVSNFETNTKSIKIKNLIINCNFPEITLEPWDPKQKANGFDPTAVMKSANNILDGIR